ncbi:MAG: phosphatidate cytidylyltransferase [Betaproteobacteria bacterium]|nr:phosphatidate cytidylyltransferase [Betaproteobacteria bacterium]
MLKQRLLTAAVLIPLLLAGMFLLSGFWWHLVLLVPLSIAAHEWARLASFSRSGEVMFVLALLTAVALVWWFVDACAMQPLRADTPARICFALSIAFWVVIAPCWLWLGIVVRNRIFLAGVGIAVLLPTWLALGQLQREPLLLLFLLAVVWIADTAAYFFGKQFGRVKLAPKISPGKTWEGVAGALLTVAVYALILHFTQMKERDGTFIITAFLSMAIFSIAGDLFESWLKRCAGVKDSGSVLPGHGGMLDRIDGVMAALPLGALIFL